MSKITTIWTYQLNNVQTEFAVNFDYLSRKFVQVTLIGKDRKVLRMNVDYRFIGPKTIKTTKAWGSNDGYQYLEIRRVTSATDPIVDFSDGSILRAGDLTIANLQAMHIAEEARNLAGDALGVNDDGQLDARARRIVNLGDPIGRKDAVNKAYVDDAKDGVIQARDKALQYRNEAQGFRNEAESFKNQAEVSKTRAVTAETNASNSASQASASSSKAQQYAEESLSSSEKAKASQLASKASEDKADEYARKAVQAASTSAKLIVDSIESLRQLEPSDTLEYAHVSSYYKGENKGGGLFYYDKADLTSEDNGGSVIVSNGKRWKKIFGPSVMTSEFGIRSNSEEAQSVAINNMGTIVKGLGKELIFEKGSYNIDQRVILPTLTQYELGVTFKGIGPSPIELIIDSDCKIEYVKFNNINLRCHNGAIKNDTRIKVCNCDFNNSYLRLGSSFQASNNYHVEGNTFFYDYKTKGDVAITLNNTAFVKIINNIIQNYITGISIEATHSFTTRNIDIIGNSLLEVDSGIVTSLTSLANCVNLNIDGNSISCFTTGKNPMFLRRCYNVNMRNNKIGDSRLQCFFAACHNVTLANNIIDNYNTYGLSFKNTSKIKIIDNTIRVYKARSYALVIYRYTTEDLDITPVNLSDLIISNNTFECIDQCIKISDYTNITVTNNKFKGKALNASGFIEFAAGVGFGSEAGNVFYKISGPSVKGELQKAPSRPSPSKTINPPVINESDSSLGNSRTYVVTFKLDDITDLKQTFSKAPKTMSTWMKEIGGSKLSFNTASLSGVRLPSYINGMLTWDTSNLQASGNWAKSFLVINKYGELYCKDYAKAILENNNTTTPPLHIVDEDVWQTASFRPPLIVDNVLYDPIKYGLISNELYNVQLSARTCLGQRKDGMFVLLIVDGKTNERGCTIKQAALKMKELGCINAYNLDGGGSTTLYYNGSVINRPSDPSGERPIWSVMYIG